MFRRPFIPVLCIVALALLAGCSTVEQKDFVALQAQVYQNQRKLNELEKKITAARKPQAELTAEVTSLRMDLAKVRGQVEEAGHALGSMPNAQALAAEMDEKNTKSREDLEKRLAQLEAYLGVKKGGGPLPAKAHQAVKPKQDADKPAPRQAAPATDKETYNLGYRLYKQKSYQAARDRFQEVLDKHPKSRYRASAQFWIGETFYAQKKYEEAILSYNQVIKRYGKSSKTPSALLKQGLAFRALGDKRTAKIVLNKLIKSYPKSSQARAARKYLESLK